jgi:hypothetical protein
MNKYILIFILIILIFTFSGCFEPDPIIDGVNSTIQESKFFKSVSISNNKHSIQGKAWYVKEAKVHLIGPFYPIDEDFFKKKIPENPTAGMCDFLFDDKVSNWKKDLDQQDSMENAEELIIPETPTVYSFGNQYWADTPRRVVIQSNLVKLRFICDMVINGRTWRKYTGICRVLYKNSYVNGEMELLIDRKGKSIVEIYETRDKYLALIRRIWYGNVNCDPGKYRYSDQFQDNIENKVKDFVETYNEAELQDFINEVDKPPVSE